MKKVISLLAAIAMVFSLVACGSTGEPKKEELAATKPAEVEVVEATTEPALDWPKKDISLIVGLGAGGDTDLNNRLMAQYVSKEIGVEIAVTNLTGSNGAVALTHYKDSGETDGYTILGMNMSALTNNEATGKMNFSWEAFDVVAVYGNPAGEMLFAGKDTGITNWDELKEASNSKNIRMAVSTGSGSHISALAMVDAGANIKIVDGGDGAGRLTSLLGGHVEIASIPYLTAKEYVENGDIVPVLALSMTRCAALPEIPQAKEVGVNVAQGVGYVWVTPKGTSPEIREYLNSVMKKICTENTEYQNAQYEYNANEAVWHSIEESEELLAFYRQNAFDNAAALNSAK